MESVNAQRVAVDCSARLGLCAWLVDQVVVVGTLAMTCLFSTAWTSLNVATEDVQLAFRDSTVVTRLSICSPVFFLLPVANALKDFPGNAKCRGNSIFCHSARIIVCVPKSNDARRFICRKFPQTILFSGTSKLAGNAPSQNWGPLREPSRP